MRGIRKSPAEERILQALTTGPKTVHELEALVFTGELRIRFLLRRLNNNGIARPGRQAPRVNAAGSPPRYWELISQPTYHEIKRKRQA
jgi:hypothetical protein